MAEIRQALCPVCGRSAALTDRYGTPRWLVPERRQERPFGYRFSPGERFRDRRPLEPGDDPELFGAVRSALLAAVQEWLERGWLEREELERILQNRNSGNPQA